MCVLYSKYQSRNRRQDYLINPLFCVCPDEINLVIWQFIHMNVTGFACQPFLFFLHTLPFKITIKCISGLLWTWELQSEIRECFHWAGAIFGLVLGIFLGGLEYACISPLKDILSIVVFISIKWSLFLVLYQWGWGSIKSSPPLQAWGSNPSSSASRQRL